MCVVTGIQIGRSHGNRDSNSYGAVTATMTLTTATATSFPHHHHIITTTTSTTTISITIVMVFAQCPSPLLLYFIMSIISSLLVPMLMLSHYDLQLQHS